MSDKDDLEYLVGQLNDGEGWLDWISDAYDGWVNVETVEGDDRRWSRWNTVILQSPSGRHWAFGYEHGLTEYQEHYYDGQPPWRVEPYERVVKGWRAIKE